MGAEHPSGKPDFSDVDDFVAKEAARDQWDATSRYSIPDLTLVAFRIIALTSRFSSGRDRQTFSNNKLGHYGRRRPINLNTTDV
ncbi:MAG: hypothetical protein LAQ30_21475 [Acidobacteriia bacterium]|nr:hypothetical protein [Terriglobia bacterium]